MRWIFVGQVVNPFNMKNRIGYNPGVDASVPLEFVLFHISLLCPRSVSLQLRVLIVKYASGIIMYIYIYIIYITIIYIYIIYTYLYSTCILDGMTMV